MTSSTNSKAASNGGTTTSTSAESKPAARPHGMARFREEECYHLTGVILVGIREAERLIDEVNTKASDRFRDYRGTYGTEPLDAAEVTTKLSEAYRLACAAAAYIDKAAERWAEETFEPPY